MADTDGFSNGGADVSAKSFDDDLKGFMLAIDQDLPRLLEQPQKIDNTTTATIDRAKWLRMGRVSLEEVDKKRRRKNDLRVVISRLGVLVHEEPML